MIKTFLQMIPGFCSVSTRQCWFGKLSGIGKNGYSHAPSILHGLVFSLLISFAETAMAGTAEIAATANYYSHDHSLTRIGPYDDEASAIADVLPSWEIVVENPNHSQTDYYLPVSTTVRLIS